MAHVACTVEATCLLLASPLANPLALRVLLDLTWFIQVYGYLPIFHCVYCEIQVAITYFNFFISMASPRFSLAHTGKVPRLSLAKLLALRVLLNPTQFMEVYGYLPFIPPHICRLMYAKLQKVTSQFPTTRKVPTANNKLRFVP
jgi:hypothetical protein